MTAMDDSDPTFSSPPAHPRTFLGLDDPLAEVAELLLAGRTAGTAGAIDLARVLLVTPGARAGRRCLAALSRAAAARGVRVVPPRTVTPGQLELELRGPTSCPLATPTEVRLAVVEAISQASEPDRGLLAGGEVNRRGIRALAERLISADRELAIEARDWSEVAEEVRKLGADDERYLAIARVFESAVRILAAEGLSEPERGRRELLDRPAHPDLEVVLVGVVELPRRLRRALDGVNVWPMVLADAGLEDCFDGWGGIEPSRWPAAAPEVHLDRILVEDKPIDVAESVVEQLAMAVDEGRNIHDDVTVVLADESLSEVVGRELEATGYPVHLGPGRPVVQLAPARELATVARFLESRTVDGLRALLGHPGIERALVAEGVAGESLTPLAAIDAWLRHQHPRALCDDWIGDPEEQDIRKELRKARMLLREVDAAVTRIFAPLSGADRSPAEWMPEVLSLLARMHPDEEADPWLDPALARIQEAATAHVEAAGNLQSPVSAAESIDMLLGSLASARVRLSAVEPAIEVIGWLETPFDPAGRMVLAGFNHGAVPLRSGVDGILPENLRRRLGLPHEESRVARDAWVLSTVEARDSRYIIGRRDVRGEGLLPSSLFLRNSGVELARRVMALFENPPPIVKSGVEESGFMRPDPPADSVGQPVPLDRIRVTAFREYLRCPHAFWLRHVLNLDRPDPMGSELDPRGFGNVLHAVVERYGRRLEPEKILDPSEIDSIMNEYLDEELAKLAGDEPSMGIRLQARTIRRRLARVAEVQAIENQSGWRIHKVEHEMRVPLEIPGQPPITVSGKVDRIDHHPELGWRVLDFKTSDKGLGPDAAHYAKRNQEWKDLQLPLYRHLLADELKQIHAGPIHTGYFLAPANLANVRIEMSSFIEDFHDEAIETAREVVHGIRSGYFPPGRKPVDGDHDLAFIQRAQTIGEVDGPADDQGSEA